MYGSPSAAPPSNDDTGSRDPEAKGAHPQDLNCYFALGYNHDSNGQIIDSLSQFLEAERRQGTEAANDAISRGWDYLRFTGRSIPYWGENDRVTLYPTIKYFLNDSPLQGKPEELHDWEHPFDGKPRKEVDGLSVLGKCQRKVSGFDSKLAVAYTTGYRNPFRFSTVRVEVGIVVFELLIVFWMQKGYMSDLSQYYRNVRGYGIEVEIGGF